MGFGLAARSAEPCSLRNEPAGWSERSGLAAPWTPGLPTLREIAAGAPLLLAVAARTFCGSGSASAGGGGAERDGSATAGPMRCGRTHFASILHSCSPVTAKYKSDFSLSTR